MRGIARSLMGLALIGAAPQAVDEDDGGRIVGGTTARGGSAPWQVEIFSTARYGETEIAADRRLAADRSWHLSTQTPRGRAHKCGGVYIGDQWILTAAHCLTQVKGNPLETRLVRMGTQDLSRAGVVYQIERAVVHRDYDDSGNPPPNDIALIRVEGAVAATPIRLLGGMPADDPVAEGDRLRVTGWGLTKARNSGPGALAADGTVNVWSEKLLQVDLTPQAEGCAVPQGFADRMICAGPTTPGGDSCKGDSGGPMTRAQGRDRVLVGLVSWGAGCALTGKPGVYTNISAYRDWIAMAKRGSTPDTLSRL